MIKTGIVDGGGSKEQVFVKDNALVVSLYGCPPMIPQKNHIFRQYLTSDGTAGGINDMRIAVGVARTDGACAEHVGPTYTFTSVSGGLLAAQTITISDTGTGGHGIIGTYIVKSTNSAASVELDRDPTDGTNETGLDYTIGSVDFFVPADSDSDRYITAVSFLIAEAGEALNQFGANNALTKWMHL